MNEQQREICALALARFGNDKQTHKAREECAELIVALYHAEDGKIGTGDVITEIADVAVMIEQLTQMFGRDRVEAEIARKLERLEREIAR